MVLKNCVHSSLYKTSVLWNVSVLGFTKVRFCCVISNSVNQCLLFCWRNPTPSSPTIRCFIGCNCTTTPAFGGASFSQIYHHFFPSPKIRSSLKQYFIFSYLKQIDWHRIMTAGNINHPTILFCPSVVNFTSFHTYEFILHDKSAISYPMQPIIFERNAPKITAQQQSYCPFKNGKFITRGQEQ